MENVMAPGKDIQNEAAAVFLLCVLLVITIVLMIKYFRLKSKLDQAQIEQSKLERHIALISRQLRESQEYKEMSEQRKQKILQRPSEYYKVKDTILGSAEELRFSRYLWSYLDSCATSAKRYVLFPQVSLHAYIQPNPNLNYDQKNAALRLIGGKNTDFLICKLDFSSNELFKPIVAVEINGEMHDRNKKTIENDEIKQAIFRGLGIPLVSHTLGSGKYIQNEVAPYLK